MFRGSLPAIMDNLAAILHQDILQPINMISIGKGDEYPLVHIGRKNGRLVDASTPSAAMDEQGKWTYAPSRKPDSQLVKEVFVEPADAIRDPPAGR